MAAQITVTYDSGNIATIPGTSLPLQLDVAQGYLHTNQKVLKAKFDLAGADKATIAVAVPQSQPLQRIGTPYKAGDPQPLEVTYDSVAIAGGTTLVTFEINPTGTQTVSSTLSAINSVSITVKP